MIRNVIRLGLCDHTFRLDEGDQDVAENHILAYIAGSGL